MNKEIELKSCREAFEAHYKGIGFNLELADEGDDRTYNWADTEELWLCWQAAQAQLQAENERLLKELNEADKQLDFGNIEYAKAAIKAALQPPKETNE